MGENMRTRTKRLGIFSLPESAIERNWRNRSPSGIGPCRRRELSFKHKVLSLHPEKA